MAIRLFVGNLPRVVTEAELRAHFSVIGPVSFLSLPTDRETGRHRGFAFVEFRERAHAEEALRTLQNKLFKGSALSLSEARPREDRAAAPRPPALARPEEPAPMARKSAPNFGPDASPQRGRGKTRGRPGPERAPKGPMREVRRGQFFGEDDDEDDDLDPTPPPTDLDEPFDEETT